MNRRMIFPILLGIVGTVVLISLGTWQVNRLAWKQELLAGIDVTLTAAPVALPAKLDPVADEYLKVMVSGTIEPRELHVLSSMDGWPAFGIISALETVDGRRILVDRGSVPETAKNDAREGGAAEITGHLVWPDETDRFIPEPDRSDNMWFAREVEIMSTELGTEPLMVRITQSSLDDGIRILPMKVNIRNNHLEYVLTWYGLAIVWVVMTLYLLWRIKRKTV